jgi:hypothetical protein
MFDKKDNLKNGSFSIWRRNGVDMHFCPVVYLGVWFDVRSIAGESLLELRL